MSSWIPQPGATESGERTRTALVAELIRRTGLELSESEYAALAERYPGARAIAELVLSTQVEEEL